MVAFDFYLLNSYVPEAEGDTYVVISMQPLSVIRNGTATAYHRLIMCGLAVQLSGPG